MQIKEVMLRAMNLLHEQRVEVPERLPQPLLQVTQLLDALPAVGEQSVYPREHHGSHHTLSTLTFDLGGFVVGEERAHSAA